jgi:hypothetical protein
MAAKSFEIWDLETRNLVDAFATEHEALEAVRDALGRHGRAYVRSWALGRFTRAKAVAIAEGDALIDRALAAQHVTKAAG